MLNGMTEPQFGGREDWIPSTPLPPEQPAPGYQPPQPPSGYPPPFPPQYPPPPFQSFYDPSAPYGRHPLTGEPLSEKSKVVAGLLQLLGLFGCGIGAIIWGIIDAVLIFGDKVRDPQNRPLRDGT